MLEVLSNSNWYLSVHHQLYGQSCDTSMQEWPIAAELLAAAGARLKHVGGLRWFCISVLGAQRGFPRIILGIKGVLWWFSSAFFATF